MERFRIKKEVFIIVFSANKIKRRMRNKTVRIVDFLKQQE
jgi:hypothetical protein